MDGRWIAQRSLTAFRLIPYINEDWFGNASTFWLHLDKWFNGTVALESTINRNFFMLFNDDTVTIQMVDIGSTKRINELFSWIISDQGKHFQE